MAAEGLKFEGDAYEFAFTTSILAIAKSDRSLNSIIQPPNSEFRLLGDFSG